MATIRDAHFPGRATIDAYGNGGFRFAGMSHRGSLLIVSSGTYGWAPRTPADIDAAAVARLLDEAAGVEMLLVGMGPTMALLAAETIAALRDRGLQAETMSTGAAVRTFNILLDERRAVAAALLAVD